MELTSEEENELLRRQLEELTGSSHELGVLMSMKYGMTHRLATILSILIRRSPAVVSRHALHSYFYGSQSDGGPDPKIFANYISRLRATLKRLGCPGEIITMWNVGWKADKELVRWVKQQYEKSVPPKE